MSHIMNPLVDFLLQPENYAERPDRVELRQTHISYVFLAGRHVYKIKKPVRFSFLDFSQLERRRFFCEEEVRLNRRLAPDVYHGVVAIEPRGSGFAFTETGSPNAIEYAVHMRRLADEVRLDELIRTDDWPAEEFIQKVAVRLAEFHRTAASSPEITANGSPGAIRAILQDNYSNARRFRGSTVNEVDDDAVQAFALGFLEKNAALFQERQDSGFIRECHGDLRTDHVYATDPLVIVDCIEFSTQFRYCDVASDLAFLVMDLDFNRRSDLARVLSRAYLAATRDPGLEALLPFYSCYRAYVRGKVNCLKSVEPEVTEAERRKSIDDAVAHFELAYRYTWSSHPGLIIVSGLSGTGKSSLAARLADRTGFVHLNSDLVRKSLAGLPPTARVSEEEKAILYGAEFSARTYAALGALAGENLDARRGVILDATFQKNAHRVAAERIGRQRGVPVLFINCEAPSEVVRRRIAERTAKGDSPSDADWAVYQAQRAAFEAYETSLPHLTIDTTGGLTEAARCVEAGLKDRSVG